MQKLFVQRTEDCVRMRKLAFDASLLGLATEFFVESLSKELASPTGKQRAEASAGPNLANAARVIDESEGMNIEDKKKQAQLGIDMAEKIAEHMQKAKNAKGKDLGTSLVGSIREGTRGLRAAVDGVVAQVWHRVQTLRRTQTAHHDPGTASNQLCAECIPTPAGVLRER